MVLMRFLFVFLAVTTTTTTTAFVKNTPTFGRGCRRPRISATTVPQQPQENLVLSIQETLQKRLGMNHHHHNDDDNDEDAEVTPLSEAETVMLMLNVETLIEELDQMAAAAATNEEGDGGPSGFSSQDETDALFGGGGIPMNDDQDEDMRGNTEIWSF